MFRNRSFRAKMALVLALPLAALVAFASLVVFPKLDARSSAEANEQQAVVATASMQMLDEVQNERDLSLRFMVAGGVVDRNALLAQREVTDARRAEFRELVGSDGGHEGHSAATERAEAAEASLDDLRAAVDSADGDADAIYGQFTDAVNAFIELNRDLSRSASNVDLARIANQLLFFTEGKEALTQIRGQGARLLDTGEITPENVAELASLKALYDAYFSDFLAVATPAQQSAYDGVIAGSDASTSLDYLDELIAASARSELPDVTGSGWFVSFNAFIESIDIVEDDIFVDFVAEADAVQSDAQRSATVYVLVTAAAVLVAGAAALVLARSLTGRLANLSDQARTIATDRLPEVLEALRNPTPEALAGALPEVTSDSSDEIGVMAASFNAVLRTSVETSINHAQRRAQTLTNILVNLGRRNQALIERQLDLIDTLESNQRDPQVLQGLFQLDHMITSMRRNAENLLVLASEQPARSWTAPVPLLDVVRSATSEVQDMSRIALDVSARDNVMIAGRHAVDLSHLLAELVENGISFSPPTTTVGVRSEGGAHQLRLWVIDSGVGMPHSEIAETNERISNPPDIDELTTDRIGFQVVGRLARRLGCEVLVQANPGGGVAVCVTVPQSVLDTGSVLGDAVAPEPSPVPDIRPATADIWGSELAAAVAEPPAPSAFRVAEPAPPARVAEPAPPVRTAAPPLVPLPVDHDDLPVRRPGHTVEVAAAGPDPALPGANLFSRASSPADAPAAPPVPTPAPAPVAAAPIPAAPPAAAQAVTDAGLVKRVPGQSAGTGRGAEAFDSGQFRRLPVPGAAANGHGGGDAESEAARRLESLSRFQRAVGRGRTADAEPEATGFPERLAPYVSGPLTEVPAPPAPVAEHPIDRPVPVAEHTSARPVIPAASGGQPADPGDVDPFDISWINNDQERGW